MVIFDINHHFWLNNHRFRLYNWHFLIKIDLLIKNISKKIDFYRKYIEFDQIYIKIEIVHLDSSLESKSDRNRQSNLDRDFDSTTTIWFGTPNRISLLKTCKVPIIVPFFNFGTSLLLSFPVQRLLLFLLMMWVRQVIA